MTIIVKKKTNNPTRIEIGPEFTKKTANNTSLEYQKIIKYYPQLFCFLDEGNLVTKTIHGLNGYEYPHENKIVKELWKIHKTGICQGDCSPADTIVDNNDNVWFVDWADANRGLQLVDVLDYVLKKKWGNESPKQFKKRFLKDKFFLYYLELCFGELARRKIVKLKQDYVERQPEQKFFEELL